MQTKDIATLDNLWLRMKCAVATLEVIHDEMSDCDRISQTAVDAVWCITDYLSELVEQYHCLYDNPPKLN